jgi:hypothetical protein
VPSSSGAEASDQQREAEAYNYNIYLMVATPYLLVGGVTFWVYRGMRRKNLADHAASDAAPPPPPPQTDDRFSTGPGGD